MRKKVNNFTNLIRHMKIIHVFLFRPWTSWYSKKEFRLSFYSPEYFQSQIVSIGLGDPIRNERLNFLCFSCNFQPWKWGNNILCKDWVRHAHNEKGDHVNLYCSKCSKWFYQNLIFISRPWWLCFFSNPSIWIYFYQIGDWLKFTDMSGRWHLDRVAGKQAPVFAWLRYWT